MSIVAGRPDRGDSLVELLVAVAILGICSSAVLGCVLMVSSASAMHQRVTRSDVILRAWAERVDDSAYVDCATPAQVAVSPEAAGWLGAAPTFTRVIDGATYTATVTGVQYWSAATRAYTTTCATDYGVQRITLTVAAPGAGLPGTSDRLDVTRRRSCAATTEAGCSG
jgi:prepilin-type N-terminal cleavage/methylation domain-containing protein